MDRNHRISKSDSYIRRWWLGMFKKILTGVNLTFARLYEYFTHHGGPAERAVAGN